jgi:hypothetical protein
MVRPKETDVKVTREHLAYLRRRIAPLDTDSRRRQYLAGDYPRAELVTDVDRRYRWDLYFASRAGIDADLPYTDNQLDTALRAVVAPLSPTAADDGYVIEKRGPTSATGLWKLTYPDGTWQRTRTKRDAQRLADLHRSDRAAWTLEVRGSGAIADGTRP